MYIRQIALVARDLDPIVDDLCAVFDIAVSCNDPGVAAFGLRNAVMPIGETFLEVVSPVTPDASARRYLERRKGDGGYMVILQSDDLAAEALHDTLHTHEARPLDQHRDSRSQRVLNLGQQILNMGKMARVVSEGPRADRTVGAHVGGREAERARWRG